MKTTECKSSDLLRVDGIYSKGFGIVPKFVMHDPDLSLESKALYAYLCALAGGGEQTFPYRETILRQMGMSKNTYYRHYNPLIEQGYITVERPANRDGANIYTLVANPKKLAVSPALPGEGMLRYNGLKAQGYGTIPRSVMTDSRLSVKAKGLYAYFCSYCGAGDCAFPYRDHILHHLGISEPTYYKALSQLKESDYLRVVQRKKDGKFAVNDYYLNEFPESEPAAQAPEAESSPEPCQKKCDTVDSPHPKKEDTVFSPYPNFEDMVAPPYPTICDTKNGDTKKCDSLLNNKNINNNTSIDLTAEKNLRELALVGLRRHAPGEAELLLEEFFPAFLGRLSSRRVKNLPAYLNASIRAFLLERDATLPPPKKAEHLRSYDLDDLERMIERDLIF